jgi:hypothetical protein
MSILINISNCYIVNMRRIIKVMRLIFAIMYYPLVIDIIKTVKGGLFDKDDTKW